MKINVLFFAQAADSAGARQASVDLPVGSNASDAWIALVRRYPPLSELTDCVALAVNETIVQPDAFQLNDGDVVAVIPPVSGG